MSEPITTPQTTLQRVREGLTGISQAAQVIGLQEHWRSLRSHQNRVDDSHEAMMQAAGFRRGEGNIPAADDEMGDNLTVTGDNVYHIHPESPRQPQQTQPKSNLPAAIALAAGLGIPLGILAYQLPKLVGKPAVEIEDKDTKNTLRPDEAP